MRKIVILKILLEQLGLEDSIELLKKVRKMQWQTQAWRSRPDMFLRKYVLRNMQQIYRITPVLKRDFN